MADDDLRQRYAEAIAAKFTSPRHRCDRSGENEWVENPEPADRVEQTPRVVAIAGDGHPSLRTPSCMEIADAVMAVRDEEMKQLRKQVADYEEAICWGTTCLEHARLLTECRRQEERAEQAEARVARVRSLAKGWANGSGLTTTLAARALLAALDGPPKTGRG